MNINEVPDTTWFADTGVTAHTTNAPCNLVFCSAYKENIKYILVMEPDWAYHILEKQSYLHHIENITTKCFSCSKNYGNLLSISQLTKDDSCIFEFSSLQFKIKEHVTGKN